MQWTQVHHWGMWTTIQEMETTCMDSKHTISGQVNSNSITVRSNTIARYHDVAHINSLSIDIVLVVADFLYLPNLFPLIRLCCSLHPYFLQSHCSSIIREKKNTLLHLSVLESCHTNLEDNKECVEMTLTDGADSNMCCWCGSRILQMVVQYLFDSIFLQFLEFGSIVIFEIGLVVQY